MPELRDTGGRFSGVPAAVAAALLIASCASDVVSMEEDPGAYERAWEADVRYVGEWEKLHRPKFLESNPAVRRFEIPPSRNSFRGLTFEIDGNISDWKHLEPLFSALRTGYGLYMETMDDPRGLRSMKSNAGLYLGFGDAPSEYADLTFLRKTRIVSIHFGDRATLKSLSGIEASELKAAYLPAGDITDYSPLQRTGLVSLILENAAHLSDLKVIARMRKLEHLELRGSGVSDLSALSGNDTIEYLTICNSPATDLTPISSMKKLKYIALANVPVTTLEPLAANADLEYVLILETPIKDLSALTKLPRLKQIRIRKGREKEMTIPEALKSRIRLLALPPAEAKPAADK